MRGSRMKGGSAGLQHNVIHIEPGMPEMLLAR